MNFIVVFALLQGLYGLGADTEIGRLFVETLGSRPAAEVIRVLTPAVGAHAQGMRLTAPGGGINIRNGCEGTEMLFLLVAAFLTAPMRWRNRAAGLALGALLVMALNQVRIVTLFYAIRADRQLFDLLHTTLLPVVLIVLVALYFYAWLYRERSLATAP